MKDRIYVKDISPMVGQTVVMAGWVHVRRDQGKMVFFDLRDMSGMLQCVVLPNHTEALEVAKEIRPEWVLKLTGIVNKRPDKNINPNIVGGDVELEVTGIEVLNKSETPVFDITADSKSINEEARLTYRYLDLRTQRMQKNIRARFSIQKFVRDFLVKENFCEIDTPLMSAPTPEGSRSYVVPSRVWKGNFYSLPQSPQQYKQLLMVGGFERYFQFAHCMRDEDTRGDRQPEFTQLDMEMSFVTGSDVMDVNERLLINLVQELYPEKKIQQIPFPRITYKDAMEKYGNDRPDIREDKNDTNLLAFCWVVDFPAFEKTGDDNVDGTGEWTFTHNPFTKVQDQYTEDYMKGINIENLISTQYDITLNGFEIGGGGIRYHKPDELKQTFKIMGYSDDRIENNFGHMIKAMEFGAPPHGGIAWGFDRLLMLLENEPNIREVIPFAKTGEGKDLMMSAPAEISANQLAELHIDLKNNS
jgi:aspartyl-tRNA synthetase